MPKNIKNVVFSLKTKKKWQKNLPVQKKAVILQRF